MRDLVYENSNKIFDVSTETNGYKCKNFILCNGTLPSWWWDCKGHYLCTNCDVMFEKLQGGKGELPIFEEKECPVCLETSRSVELAYCNHTICIKCFKRMFYSDGANIDMEEPIFPYNEEIYDKYIEDENNPKWVLEYPLLKEYEKNVKIYYDKIEELEEKEEYLRHCPFCRK